MPNHVCPVWAGPLITSPVRKIFQNPARSVDRYVQEGMTALDVGCAMGFFSLPLAERVGARGSVVCIDSQEPMITSLEKRADKAGLRNRIRTRVCKPDSLGIEDLEGTIDFAIACAVLHEVPDASSAIDQVFRALKPAGTFLITEPRGHVSAKTFELMMRTAENTGYTVLDAASSRFWHRVVLRKPALDSGDDECVSAS